MKKKFGSVVNNITRHIDSFRETVAEVQKKAKEKIKEKGKEEKKPEQPPEKEVIDIYTLMSYNELRNLARQYGISTYRMKKEDLIVELKKHEEG